MIAGSGMPRVVENVVFVAMKEEDVRTRHRVAQRERDVSSTTVGCTRPRRCASCRSSRRRRTRTRRHQAWICPRISPPGSAFEWMLKYMFPLKKSAICAGVSAALVPLNDVGPPDSGKMTRSGLAEDAAVDVRREVPARERRDVDRVADRVRRRVEVQAAHARRRARVRRRLFAPLMMAEKGWIC